MRVHILFITIYMAITCSIVVWKTRVVFANVCLLCLWHNDALHSSHNVLEKKLVLIINAPADQKIMSYGPACARRRVGSPAFFSSIIHGKVDTRLTTYNRASLYPYQEHIQLTEHLVTNPKLEMEQIALVRSHLFRCRHSSSMVSPMSLKRRI